MTFFLYQLNLWKFSVWATAIALYSSYLITFFFLVSIVVLAAIFLFFFLRPLQKKILANPPLYAHIIRSKDRKTKEWPNF
jgi:hypothetical protein